MSATTSNTDSPYYFVPFGRERGGYLELLGLPPSATDVEARKRDGEFRKEAEQTFKGSRKKLKEQLAENLISQKQYDEELDKLKKANNDAIVQLNELKGKFDAMQAERRGHGNKGQSEDATIWFDMVPLFGAEGAEGNGTPARAPGDYFEFLGLSPDADVSAIARKEAEHRLEVERTFKTRRKELREKCAAGELTQEELDAQVRQLEEERERAYQKPSELKAAFEALQKEHRQRQLEKFWQLFWQFLLKPRPLSNISPELILEIEERWIDSLSSARDEQQKKYQWLPSQQISNDAPIDLAILSSLVRERDLIRLLTADAFWSKVPYTNRKYWSETIMAWAKEMAGPSFRLLHEADGAGHSLGAVEYPSLSQPTDMAIVMRSELTLPQVDEEITEAVINKWLKKVGDSVEIDEPILQFTMGDYIETRLVSHVNGILAEMKAEEGKPIKPTDIIAVITRKTI